MLYNDRLKEIFKTASFLQLVFYKIMWNFTGRKFQAVMMGLALYLAGVDDWTTLVLVGAYAGVNIMEKVFRKG